MIVRVVLLLLGLIAGGLLAAAAFYGVFGPSTPQPVATAAPPPPPPPPPTMIVVAAKEIPTGTLVQASDLKFAPIEPDQLNGGDYLRVTAPTPRDQQAADRRTLAEIAGGVTRVRFDEGEAVRRGQTVKPGDAGFLAAVLRPGMRALTMSVNLVTGNNGLLTPGDHVDVLLTQTFSGHENDPGNRSASETIATDLRVIAIDQRMQAGGGGEMPKEVRPAQTVTLEVTALQAEQVAVAGKMGELALEIRGLTADLRPGTKPGEQNATAPSPPPPVWAKDLSQAAAQVKPAPAKEAAAAGPSVRIIRGEKTEKVAVP